MDASYLYYTRCAKASRCVRKHSDTNGVSLYYQTGLLYRIRVLLTLRHKSVHMVGFVIVIAPVLEAYSDQCILIRT